MISAPLRSRASTTTVASAEARDDAVARREPPRRRRDARRVLGDDQARARRSRARAPRARAGSRGRCRSRARRPSRRPPRAQPRWAQPSMPRASPETTTTPAAASSRDERPRDVRAVVAAARAPTIATAGRASSSGVGLRRGGRGPAAGRGSPAAAAGTPRSERASQRIPALGEPAQLGALVERRDEAAKRCRPALAVGRVRVARRREDRQCELAHRRRAPPASDTTAPRRRARPRSVSAPRERGDRPRDPGDPRAAPTRQRQPLDRSGEQLLAPPATASEALATPLARRDARAREPRRRALARRRRRARPPADAAARRRGRSGRAAPARAGRGSGRARCGEHEHSARRIAAAAARTQVHRPDELEPRRERCTGRRPARSAITPSSSGWRSASSTGRANSGSSSSSRTP